MVWPFEHLWLGTHSSGNSCDVHRCQNVSWIRYCFCNCLWLSHAWWISIPKRKANYDFSLQCILVCRIVDRFRNYCSNCNNQYRLGMENSISSSSLSLAYPDNLRLVSISWIYHETPNNRQSFLPESPRYLISKDRRDEAFDILVKYHAEGHRDSVFVRAEMAQIETTIKLEVEASKQSWMSMLSTPGMRRRVFLASAMGVFTQWSGNTLISWVPYAFAHLMI